MLARWWQRMLHLREERVLHKRAIPEPLWALTLARFPFLTWRDGQDLQELRRLASLFLDRKEFTGAHGLVVTDAMAVSIAAQACLPLLHGGAPERALAGYDDFVGIVVHPAEAVARQTRRVLAERGLLRHPTEPPAEPLWLTTGTPDALASAVARWLPAVSTI